MSTSAASPLAGRVIRCVLFDLGDTLWTYDDKSASKRLAQRRAVAELLERVGLDALPLSPLTPVNGATDPVMMTARLDALGERIWRAVNDAVGDAAPVPVGGEPELARMTRDTLRALGVAGADLALGEAVYEALRVRIPGSRRLFDDALGTLATLRERGFALGVVTNRHWGGARFQEDLRALGLLDLLEPQHIAISADLGLRKPNPAIFRSALDALGAAPGETAMVGDSLRADVAGAHTLGLFAIWKPRLSLRAEAEARWLAARPAPDGDGAQPMDLGASLGMGRDDGLAPQPENYRTADEYLLACGVWREFAERLPTPIRPDLIITHVGDLLPLLQRPGAQ